MVDGVGGRHRCSSGTANPLRVAVAGKGGVGKTTISATLVKCLSARGLRVLAVDADPTALLGAYLGVALRGTVSKATEGARKAVRRGAVARPRELVRAEIERSLLHTPYGALLTMGAPGGRGCYCAANSAVRSTLEELERAGTPGTAGMAGASAGPYDVTLVDCEPGLEIFSRGTLDGTDKLVVVAEPTAAGLLVASHIWQTAEELGLPAATQSRETRPVLLNKVHAERATLPPGAMPPYLSNLLSEHRLHAEWIVPFDRLVAEATQRGQPVAAMSGDTLLTRAVDALAGDLVMRSGWVEATGLEGIEELPCT